jgi:BirA family biotin operon repressor/biotin-[acetyl-CoA-carboxylase] ligase
VAVWKEVQNLKSLGFPIVSSHSGYRLVGFPDRFEPEFLEPYLEEKVQGIEVIYKEEVDSTNTFLRRFAENAREGTLCIAERQTQGRGRRGRSWFSLEGKSLTFSLLLRPNLPLGSCVLCTLLAGLSLGRALRSLGFPAELKWPNDVLLRGKKVAGVLLEAESDFDCVPLMVLGVGVNVNLTREDLAALPFATSLYAEEGRKIPRIEVLRAFLSHFIPEYVRLRETGDFSSWVLEYNAMCTILGQEITVLGGKEKIRGIAKRVDASGALWVEEGGEERPITWGEIE